MDKDLESYRSQLASNPDDAEALARLESALIRSGDWAGVVALIAERTEGVAPDEAEATWMRLVINLEERVAEMEEPRQASALALAIGVLWEERLDRADEAMLRYQKAFQLDAANLQALQAARRSYEGRENWELVLQLYNLELQQTDDGLAQRIGSSKPQPQPLGI